MSRRLVAGAAVGTTLVLALAACGSSGRSADAGPGGVKLTANEVLLKTSKQTSQVSSFSADVTMDSSGSGHSGSTHATGQVQLRPSVKMNATLDKASMGGFTLNSPVSVVLLDNVVYAKIPSQFSQFSSFTGGKQWVKVDLNAVGQKKGVDAASAVQQMADFIDPGNLTKTFTASKDATKVGDEAIDGVNTTHYKGTVTVKDALAQLDPATQQKLKGLYDKAGNKAVAFDLWADGQGLAHKVSIKAADQGESSTLTVVYSGFNNQVTVNAPPSQDVGTLNFPGFGGQNG